MICAVSLRLPGRGLLILERGPYVRASIGTAPMRVRIVFLAATGFVIASLSGFAAEPFSSQSRLEQRTSAEGDEFSLKSTGGWSRSARTADEDRPLKSAGASSKPGRAADEDKPLKSAGASSRTGRMADDDQPLKSAGASSRPGRKVEEIAPLRSAGGVTRPARIEDEGNRM
jgi:hypothetical protein